MRLKLGLSNGNLHYRFCIAPVRSLYAAFQQTDHHIVWHRFCLAVHRGSAGLVGFIFDLCQRALASHRPKATGCIALAADAKHAQRHAVRADEKLVFSRAYQRSSIARDAKVFATKHVQK